MKDLEQENKELKEALEFKSDLISMTAHQLRTSMSATKWVLKMLLDGDLGPLTEEQKIFIKKTEDNNEKMITFVSEMIDINKEESREIRYTFGKYNLKELVCNTVGEFRGEAAKKDVSLKCHCEEFSKPVEVDREKIQTVIQGLVENAIKYNKEGGSVTLSSKEDGDFVIISVEDTGIGIAEKEKEKIFDKFFRTDSAKKHESIGSGLGLFVIQRIVERHNGEIWFDSKEGIGTTFNVKIPFNQ